MDTVFYPGTVVTSEWLNDVNRLNYTVFNNPSTLSDVVASLISAGILSSVTDPETGGGGGGGGTVVASATFDTHSFTATGGETLVSLPFTYTLGGKTLLVYVNGLLQYPSDHYTETSVSSITFITALEAGDKIRIVGNISTTAYVPEQAALAAIYALTPAADKFIYFTSSSAAALGTVTSFIRTLMDDADAAAARTTLGVSSTTEMNTAIAASSFGVSQKWYNVKASRAIETPTAAHVYQAPTKMIQVAVSWTEGSSATYFKVSDNGSTWITITRESPCYIDVPANHYYKLEDTGFGSSSINYWAELR